jgi:hypothetical protein
LVDTEKMRIFATTLKDIKKKEDGIIEKITLCNMSVVADGTIRSQGLVYWEKVANCHH